MTIIFLLISIAISIIIISQKVLLINLPIKIVCSTTIALLFYSIIYYLNLLFGLPFDIFIYFVLFFQIIYMYKFFDFNRFHLQRFQNFNLFSFLVILSTGVLYFQKQIIPWGAWDGTFIWNLHAKFLADQELWIRLFSKQISWSHPDYPLFLPSLIAMFWNFNGSVSTIIPILISLLPLLGIIVLLFSSFNNTLIGFFPCAIILSDKIFMGQASSQYADTWLAFFILLGTYLIKYIKDNKSLFFITGIVISGAFWVKNEGLFFFLITSFLVFFQYVSDKKLIVKYFSGTIVLIIILIVFKTINYTENDMLPGLFKTFGIKLFDSNRYILIFKYFKITILEKFPILPLLLLFSVIFYPKFEKLNIYPFLGIIFLICTYFFIYLFTPKDLAWHLETSLDRLIHHVYPSLLFLFFMGIEGISAKTN